MRLRLLARLLAELKILSVFLLALVAIALVAPSEYALAAGNTYYVAKNGSDANVGTEAAPWLTIQKAADTTAAGDTVYIKTGIYNEQVFVKHSGSSGKWITFASYPGHTAVIDGTGLTVSEWEGLVNIISKSYIKVSGLKIMNSQWAGVIATWDWGSKIPSSYIVIENNYIYNTHSSAVLMAHGSNYVVDGNEIELCPNGGPDKESQEIVSIQCFVDNFEVKNNHIFNAGISKTGGEGIDAKNGASNGRIHHNYVHNVKPVGIYVDAYAEHQSNIEVYCNIVHSTSSGVALAAEQPGGVLEKVSVYNNICYGNYWSMLIDGPKGAVVKDCQITNNVFWDNDLGMEIGSFEGVTWIGSVENVAVRNNIFSRNHRFQIVVDDRPELRKNITVDHNIVDGFRGYSDEVKGTDCIEAAPQFVNPSRHDFHLRSTSPAIDSGSPAGAPAADFDGNTRPHGTGYDIGAYEFKAEE